MKIERFNKDAISKKVDDYFEIVVNDCNEIKDIRFLILRFCIACEKVIDDFLSIFEEKNCLEIEDIRNLQLTKFKVGDQKCLVKINDIKNSFAIKVSIMKSICDYKNQNMKFLEFLDFLRDVRNIVGHQLITINEIHSYLIKEKNKFVYSFVEDKAKLMLDQWINTNNFHEVLKFLLPIISIEINKLQVKALNH